jgi:hypothetical protein
MSFQSDKKKEDSNPVGIVNIVMLIWYIPFTVALFLVLAVSSATTIYYDFDQQSDLPRYMRENIPLLLVLVFAILCLLQYLRRKTSLFTGRMQGEAVPGKRLPLSCTMRAALFFAASVSLYLILIIRGLAVNDGLIMDGIINQFMQGDFSELRGGGYLAVYPFQIGYIAVGQLLYVLFGPSNYIVYMLLNIPAVLITLWMLYEITWELFESREICDLMAVLSTGMFFLFCFTTFVYGDLWSFAPMTAALYLTMRYLKYHKRSDEIWSGILIGAAVVLKSNCYIAVVAMVIMLLLDGLRNRKQQGIRLLVQNILLAVLLVIFAKGMTGIINTAYSRATGVTPWPKGTPSSTYFAMGMQEAGGEGGWYNGYNRDTYTQSGMNRDLADQTAKREIADRLRVFRQRPLHAVNFYVRKFLSQWADESCISMHDMEETSRHVTGQTEILNWILYGGGRVLFRWIMNLYQALCYLGTAVFCIDEFRKKRFDFLSAFLVLFIFGGMAFHELWEASGRYTMRYYICMLPLAAFGIDLLLKKADCITFRKMGKQKR